jgi:pilus assembly protein CpaB
MGQKRPLVFLGIAVVLALATTVMVYQWLQGQRGQEVETAEVVVEEGIKVAVAITDIAWGTPLAAQVVKMVKYPEDALPVGHFQEADTLEGRVVLANLKKNEPILESKLAPLDVKTGGVSAVMDPSKRAMAVKVNNIVGLPGFVQPGDHVDVMATFSNPYGKEGADTITKVVLENTLVLAIGTTMERGKDEDGNEKPTPVKVITLEVTLEEAEKLAMAENGGKLRLALRSPLNPDLKKTRGATFKDLKASHQLKPPRKKGAKPKTRVEVINGSKRTTLKF